MKKWLVGCLVTGLILAALVAGAGYWFIWRPLSASGSDIMGQVSDLKKLGEAEQSVKNQSPYTAPADGKLSPAQVTAFVAIQQVILDKMGTDFALMEEKYTKLAEQNGSKPEDTNLKDVMGAYADITSLMTKAKQAQVAGLNAQSMSMEEYRWIRDQVSAALPYITMDAPVPATDAKPETAASDVTNDVASEAPVPDKEAIAKAAVEDAVAKAQAAAEKAIRESVPGGQAMQDAVQGADSEAARANAELLRPHKELLFKTMTTAWLAM